MAWFFGPDKEPKKPWENICNGVTIASHYGRIDAAAQNWRVAVTCVDLLGNDIEGLQKGATDSHTWSGPVAQAVRGVLDLARKTIAERNDENRDVPTQLDNAARHLKTAYETIPLPPFEEIQQEINDYRQRFYDTGRAHTYAIGDFDRRAEEIARSRYAHAEPMWIPAGETVAFISKEDQIEGAINWAHRRHRRLAKQADEAFSKLEEEYEQLNKAFPPARGAQVFDPGFDLDGDLDDDEAGTGNARQAVERSSVASPPFPGMAAQGNSGPPSGLGAGQPTQPGLKGLDDVDSPDFDGPDYAEPQRTPSESDYEGLAGYNPGGLGGSGGIGPVDGMRGATPVDGMRGATPVAGTQLAGRLGAPGSGGPGSMYASPLVSPLVPPVGRDGQGNGQNIVKPEKQPELEPADDALPRWLIA